MPNRILKDSICTSENIDQLSMMAEIAFYRLIVNCDDYGRMDGRVKILKSRLFPLKDITEETMREIMNELINADLISMYEVNGRPYLQLKTWEDHQQVRAKKSKYPSSSESTCNQLKSDDNKCPRNPIQSESLSESLSESESKDADAHAIQHDHDRILNAAEDAGFKMSNSVRAALIDLYSEHGLEKMLAAFRSCVEHAAPNLAYLKAVLKGEPKKSPPGKVVSAQQYSQRDYSGEDQAAMRRMLGTG